MLTDKAELEAWRELRRTRESHCTGVLLAGQREMIRLSLAARRALCWGDQGTAGLYESCQGKGKAGGLPWLRCVGLPRSMCLVEENGAFFKIIL